MMLAVCDGREASKVPSFDEQDFLAGGRQPTTPLAHHLGFVRTVASMIALHNTNG